MRPSLEWPTAWAGGRMLRDFPAMVWGPGSLQTPLSQTAHFCKPDRESSLWKRIFLYVDPTLLLKLLENCLRRTTGHELNCSGRRHSGEAFRWGDHSSPHPTLHLNSILLKELGEWIHLYSMQTTNPLPAARIRGACTAFLESSALLSITTLTNMGHPVPHRLWASSGDHVPFSSGSPVSSIVSHAQ